VNRIVAACGPSAEWLASPAEAGATSPAASRALSPVMPVLVSRSMGSILASSS
jgi:hypothetical protein